MNPFAGRRGVASVIGTLFFVFVFMIAIGAQAYMSGLQSQSSQAAEAAQNVVDRKVAEALRFDGGGTSVTAVNTGGSLERFRYVVLRFNNGSAYALQTSAAVPPGSSEPVAQMVPSGTCGKMQCSQKYNLIATGAAAGAVGVVTSFGNTYWYSPTDPTVSGGVGAYYWTLSRQSTSSTSFVPLTGLAFTGTANSFYRVYVRLGYYQSAINDPGLSFAASGPAGASVFACGGMEYPDVAPQCTSSFNAQVGMTVFGGDSVIGADYCVGATYPCVYGATIDVVFGSSGGTFQLEFKTAGATTGSVIAGSSITVAEGVN
ncbi:MAG: hypothetical protein HY296_01025 [Thaumarchaeota archaeon]|nr:hypothetical protein [Nitrososphaerota archaeon]